MQKQAGAGPVKPNRVSETYFTSSFQDFQSDRGNGARATMPSAARVVVRSPVVATVGKRSCQ